MIFLAPRVALGTNRPKVAEPEVWFRVINVTAQDNEAFQEQTVEVTLGPKGAFEKGNVGVIKWWVADSAVVNSLLPQPARPQKIPMVPRVADLLRKALEWQELLNNGSGTTQAKIASREGFSRPRVTQIMDLLNLAPDIQKHILSMPETARKPVVTERSLRPIIKLADTRKQLAAFRSLSASE